jgi:transposase
MSALDPEMIRLYLLGYSTIEISNKYGVSRKRVVAYLEDNGVTLRSGGMVGRRESLLLKEALRRYAEAKRTKKRYVPPKPAWTFEDMITDYLINGYGKKALSEKYGVSEITVHSILHKYNVPMRPRGAPGHITPARNPNSEKTHCSNGHPFDDENTIIFVRKNRDNAIERRCRACQKVWKQRYLEKKRSA